jgi:glycerophosphoryl diester phosphodiesterase
VPRRVDQLSFEELSSLRVEGHQIPTLAQVLQHFPTQKFNLDVKTSAAIRPTALELVKFEALDRVLLTSFSSIRRKRTVREVRKLAGANIGLAQSAGIGEVFLLWLFSRVGASSLARIISRELTAVQLPPKAGINLSSPSFAEFVRRQGLNLHYWSVNDVQAMHDLLEIGATGLVTDETANAVTVISLRA